MTTKEHITQVGVWLLLLVGFSGPLLGASLLTHSRDSIDATRQSVVARWVSAPSATRDGARTARLVLTWATGEGLRAPAWNGTITATDVAPGSSISEGSPVLAVNGVKVVAVATPNPFYRALDSATTGEDVAQLNQLLNRLGYRHGVGPRWTTETGAGVGRLATALGLPAGTTVFDPGWTVWMPSSHPFTVGALKVAAGQNAPSQGDVFAEPASTLVRAEVVDEQGKPLTLDGGKAWAFAVPGSPVRVDLPAAGPITDPTALGQLSAGTTPGSEAVEGTVAYAAPIGTTTLPVPAVVTDASGTTCVWVRDSPMSEAHAVGVTVVDGDVGATFIAQRLPEGDSVLSNPTEVLKEPRCS